MTTIDTYSQEKIGPYEYYNVGDFQLTEGGIIPNLQLAYVTYGELNETKTNAILVPTWFSGNHQGLAPYIGTGRALDPEKYFIIVVNQIGNGVSTSPHNSEASIAKNNFPRIQIEDDVRAQYQLITEKFGIEELALVVGGSMGAQQTYEWAVRYPNVVKRAAPIAGTAKVTLHNGLFTQTLQDAITSDPAWNEGNYNSHTEVSAGLQRIADIFAVTGFSTTFYHQEKWKLFGIETFDEFIKGFLRPLFQSLDPNSLLTMAWKWQQGDVSRNTNGDLTAALNRIQSKVFVLAIEDDLFFPIHDIKAEQALIPNSELKIIKSNAGHLALFGPEAGAYFNQIDEYLTELLAVNNVQV